VRSYRRRILFEVFWVLLPFFVLVGYVTKALVVFVLLPLYHALTGQ
jgi:hypothetical protein